MKLTLSSPMGSLNFDTQKRETVIGRENDCDWVISSEKLSRKHCIFFNLNDSSYAIMDLGSKNGITVDGIKIAPNQMVPVTKNSIIVLANQYFLSFGVPNKAEMIEMIPTVRSRPMFKKRSKKSGSGTRSDNEDAYDFDSEEFGASIIPILKRAVVGGIIILGLSISGIYFFMFK